MEGLSLFRKFWNRMRACHKPSLALYRALPSLVWTHSGLPPSSSFKFKFQARQTDDPNDVLRKPHGRHGKKRGAPCERISASPDMVTIYANKKLVPSARRRRLARKLRSELVRWVVHAAIAEVRKWIDSRNFFHLATHVHTARVSATSPVFTYPPHSFLGIDARPRLRYDAPLLAGRCEDGDILDSSRLRLRPTCRWCGSNHGSSRPQSYGVSLECYESVDSMGCARILHKIGVVAIDSYRRF